MSKSIFLPPDQTRTISIIAHVDHGKTTLADNLIERNGIISERLAGTMRYLDSLEEEQRRGITMRASAIGLKHTYTPPGGKKKKEGQQEKNQPMIIHLLDSPGHTDFSSEVSSSLQCCDGALLVVDAVEGMCARTHQVLREAHVNQLVPILVINKVDRLCTDLCLNANEAYLRLRALVENANAAAAAMLTSARYYTSVDNDDEESKQEGNGPVPNNHDSENSTNNKDEEEEKEDELWTFDPMKGNVIFTSALYGWGFTVPSLSRHLFRNNTLPMKPMVLKQYLFGDYKYRDGKVLKWKSDNTDELSFFAEFALQPIWKVYEGVAAATASLGLDSDLFADGRASLLSSSTGSSNSSSSKNNNPEVKITSKTPGMELVLDALQMGATGNHVPKTAEDVHAILSQTGSYTEEAVLRALLRRYRPMSDVVLDTVCEYCPSPATAASSVRPRALAFCNPSEPSEYFIKMKRATAACDPSPDGPTVAHICKFMGADRRHVRDSALHNSNENDGDDSDEDDNVIMGLARVLCGTLKTDSEYYVLGPKHKSGQEAPKRKVRLYLLMGSDFVQVQEVSAGHLCAISHLDDLQLKTVTICDEPGGMPLQGFERGARPLVKVNVEAVDAADTDILERGLLQLSLADAAVEVTATSKGERILACLGEIHLEQSINDLRRVYCKKKDIELRVSDPIVEFGETTTWFTDKQEDTDFQTFFDDPSPVLRQTTIPPYNEEEGLAYARHGRTRAVISGQCAAISLRVVPLASSVYQAMKEGKIVNEDCEEELLRIGRALQCFEKLYQEKGESTSEANNMTAESVLSLLCESLCAIDNNGNALVQSRALMQGLTAKAVESDVGRIFVPSAVDGKKLKEDEDEDGHEDQDGDYTEGNDGAVSYCCTDEHDLVRGRIRRFGLYGIKEREGPSKEETNLEKIDKGALQIWKDNLSSAVAGFHIAVRSGPICEEPVRNVMVVLEGFEVAVAPKQGGAPDEYESAKTLSSGMIMSAMRSGVRSSLLTRPARLIEGHLLLTLHSSLTGLGPLYTVLSRRRGKVVRDDMVDGTDLIMISATLPQAESFGLAPELFKSSSGQVTAPELIFSHWKMLDEDPFWIPTSLEEREDFGEILQSGDLSTGIDNTALKLIRQVRIRKGLLVESNRTVVAAEKQRTRKR